MKLRLSIAALAAVSAWAQVPGPTPLSAELAKLPDTAVYATVNGRDVTVAEMKKIAARITQPGVDPKELLKQIELMNTLAKEAEQNKLDQQSPWKDDLEWNRLRLLATAQVNEYYKNIEITPDAQKSFYDSNKNRFEQARIRMIYIPFSSNANAPADAKGKKPLTEAEAKAKIEDLRKQIQGGADFAKVATENSADSVTAAKGGDFGQPIRRSDKQLPPPVLTAIFAAKPGEVTEPVRQPNGFYLFKVEELSPVPYEQVKDEIYMELKTMRHRDLMAQKTGGIKVELKNPAPAAASAPATGATAASR